MSLESHVTALRSKHADLDREVADLERSPSVDPVSIREAKRRKLAVKDQIQEISAQLQ